MRVPVALKIRRRGVLTPSRLRSDGPQPMTAAQPSLS
jgi:hypothetical protein